MVATRTIIGVVAVYLLIASPILITEKLDGNLGSMDLDSDHALAVPSESGSASGPR